ncbi:MAG: YjaG family protein [Succinivibrio sp.]|nr:YjaG family protein [Succinivibrio sp.]
MFFGAKFYQKLHKLSPWQQSLFALALTMHQKPNLVLCCEVGKQPELALRFEQLLEEVKTFHQDKFNHLDLAELAAELETLLPALDQELSLGDLYVQDTLLSLQVACEAVFLHEGSEAEQASNLSLGGVFRRLEAESGAEPDEDELHEHPLVEAELQFQLSVLRLFESESNRSQLLGRLEQLLEHKRVSNIGISADA